MMSSLPPEEVTRPALSPKKTAPPPIRHGLLGLSAGAVVLACLFGLGLYYLPRFQATNPPTPLQRSDANRVAPDDLYLDLTLVTPSFLESRKLERHLGGRDPRSVLPILVGLNTHTGSIGHLHHLPGKLELIAPDDTRYPSLTEPIVLSQHHNAYLLLFPAQDHHGRRWLDFDAGSLAVEATGMGAQGLRRFEWELPIPDQEVSLRSAGLATRLTLMVALLSALLVVLSPCALELSLYYSAIISCTVTEGEREAAADVEAVADASATSERRVWINLLSFVGGFTLLYAVSGATVGLIGEGVRQPLAGYGDWFPRIGGALIVLFALRVAGIDRLMTGLWHRLGPSGASPSHSPGQSLSHHRGHHHGGNDAAGGLVPRMQRTMASFRRHGHDRVQKGYGMRARDSFIVGLGLSSACLTCMGGAVLYPLLVYAGVTSWYSGLVTLTLYSLGIALPMLWIALGFSRIRLTLTRRLGFNRALRLTSATLLLLIGSLLAFGYERLITDVAFGTMADISRWSS